MACLRNIQGLLSCCRRSTTPPPPHVTSPPVTTPTSLSATTPSSPVTTPTSLSATTPPSPVTTPTSLSATTPPSPVTTPTSLSATTPPSPVTTPTNLSATTPPSPVTTPTSLSATTPPSPVTTPTNLSATTPPSPVTTPTSLSATTPPSPVTTPTNLSATTPPSPVTTPTSLSATASRPASSLPSASTIPGSPTLSSKATPDNSKSEFLDAWFPALQTDSYIIPTEHFRTVHEQPTSEAAYTKLLSEDEIYRGFKANKANKAARNVLAVENILERVHTSMNLIRKKSPNDVMVIMTQTKTAVYKSVYAGAADLNNNEASSAAGARVEKLKRDISHDVADLLVVDRDHGVVMGAVVRNTGADPDSLRKELNSAIAYLKQAREIVNTWVISAVEGGSQVHVHATILLPNLLRADFERAANLVRKELEDCLDVQGQSDVNLRCLCHDDIKDVTQQSLMRWWAACRGEKVPMEESVYRELVYRFAVPLLTVTLHLGAEPRIQLWNKGQVVHALGEEYGRGWTRLALFPEQARVLNKYPEDEEDDDDVVLLHGPPGTSKTFLLMLRASRWMKQHKPLVTVTQTRKDGLAASLLIQHQLGKVEEKVGGCGVQRMDLSGVGVDSKGKVTIGQEELDAGLEELCRGAVGGAVHLLADEANGGLVGRIYSDLKKRKMVVRMWAAGVELTIPDNMKDKRRVLRQPLRCPRAVTEEVRQSRIIKEGEGEVPDYSEPEVARAHRGLPPDYIEVDGEADSEEAGRAVGKHLKKLGVGVRPPGGQRALRYRDVFVLGYWGVTDFADVSRGLRAEGVPARHEPRDGRDELTAAGRRDWVGGLATGGGEDAVTVTGYDTVTGLERPVVVWLDEGGGTDIWGRLHAMSRATAHLIIVRRKYDDSSSSSSSS